MDEEYRKIKALYRDVQGLFYWGLNVQTQVESKKTSSDGPGNDNTAFVVPMRKVENPYQGVGSADDWNRVGYVHVASERGGASGSAGKSGGLR